MTAAAVSNLNEIFSWEQQGNPLKVTVGVVSRFERNLQFVSEWGRNFFKKEQKNYHWPPYLLVL